jgi:ATP-binding cassette, subfamily B, bacterial PglK
MIVKRIVSYSQKVFYLIGSAWPRLSLLLPLYLLSSGLDLIGISLFVALASSLGEFTAFPLNIDVLSEALEIENISKDRLVMSLAVLVLILHLVKTALALYVTNLMLKITFTYGADLRSFFMRTYQNLPYSKFTNQSTSSYLHNVQAVAGQFVTYTIQPLLRIFSDGILAILIIIFLAYTNTLVLLSLLLLMSVAGAVYDRVYSSRLASYGAQLNAASSNLIKRINETLNAYKESHIYGILEFFHRHVSVGARVLAKLRIKSQMIKISAKYILECFVVTCLVIVVIISITLEVNKENLLTSLLLFLVAAMRLMPATSQIVTSIGNMRYGAHSVELLYTDIKGAGYDRVDLLNQNTYFSPLHSPADTPYEDIQLHNVSFRYEDQMPWLIEKTSLRIQKNETVGIIGSSGAGKTTLVGLILGLLEPTYGKVTVGENNLADIRFRAAWHKKISYLPQQGFLMEGSIAANVALGIDDSVVDARKLNEALTKAGLKKFVESMPHGVRSLVGERGSRISGGQSQRIALARAFYYDSEVLILDEPTNALDAQSTKEIIDELRSLGSEVTIIIITHQEEPLTLCNRVFRLKDGALEPLENLSAP